MFKVPVSEIMKKISEATGLSEEDILKKIKEKMKSLEGLVSEEGAAHIIAHELGVEVFKAIDKKEIKINEAIVGMRQFEIAGVVSRIFETRTFRKKDGTGKISSFVLEDETGSIRVILWNEMTKLVESEKIKEGKTMIIKNGMIRSNEYNGRESKEIHTNTKTEFNLSPSLEINIQISEKAKEPASYLPKNISELKDNDFAKIRGSIVSVFVPRIFLSCPECGKKVLEEGSGFECRDHKKVTPKKAAVFSFVVDDGTENIRCSSFRDVAEKIVDMDAEKIDSEIKSSKDFEETLSDSLLGTEIEVVGRVKSNQQYMRKEFMVSGVNKTISAVSVAQTLLGE